MLFIEVNLNKSDNEIAPNQFVVRNVTKYSGLSHNITSLNASVTGLVITVSFILTEYWKFLRIFPTDFSLGLVCVYDLDLPRILYFSRCGRGGYVVGD